MNQGREEQRRQHAASLRYRRPALAMMGYDMIQESLYEMSSFCDDIRWAEENCTQPVLDGDEDDGAGYRMEFSDLEAAMDTLSEQLDVIEPETFDDCTVGLIGNRYRLIGYDSYEEDYFSLCSWDRDRAQTVAGKRLTRLTKSDMIATIGQCVGILLAFYDLRQQYDCIRAALDIVLGQNLDELHTVRSIEEAYERWCDEGCYAWGESYHALDRAGKELGDIYWIA